ncbi:MULTISPECIES: membrane-bound lytic murein transglycosylase MltF [Idiomarinaceae]|uniref:Membrane-bound lytic murein transglycosylase F n=2 Tax=Pseudidiomarina TaxID=2800384 RepID=A0AB39X4M0_9GAMM|nr:MULTISPECIES: membrane-bound lytic murein transglycosylase MltF [Idiomarinaceae]MDT7526236.1 membrane-bound lytic murein transglycosylase MltF [Pseudidiomarina sp. GXY010]MRJ41563.1 membrane-bound lytic murein transglycosylase MltF [Idiomarina sp. FeN1]NCU57553.1 membrane-bound lytic murein transglycosylase MltF [Idiomarina sp. FenA--70]NCU60105.1 membrane-bound lytic murein transglycosylase MltF [Idiomarina sp. FenBw--71]UUN13798.1 membrane-bound lytic murein transglycosylase MltF [Idiomar
MLRVLLSCCWLLLIVGCTPAPEPSQLEQIKARGVLKVGTLMGPSTYYLDANGEAGIEAALAQQFADELGVALEMVPRYNVKNLLDLLANNEVDLLAAGLDRTPQRDQLFRFGPPYLEVSQRVIYKQGSRDRPRSLTELDGELVVVANSSHHDWLQSISSDYPELKWRATDDQDTQELLRRVMLGEIDFTIADSNTLDIQRRYYPNLSVAFTVRDRVDVGWMLASQVDGSLYAEVIDFFGELRASGQLAQLMDQHFGHVANFNYVDASLFIQAVETTLPRYREMFERHAGSLDWRLLAAISYQESHWNPRALSPTGVRGMMMLTLPTAKAMGVTSRLNPEQSIRGGARYFERMLQRIPARIQHPDRIWFALAAYNIGFGHLEDARILTQQQGADPDRWIDVRKRLPLLRQKKYYRQTKYGFARGDEPVRYVGNIRRYYDTLIWLDSRGRIPAKPMQILLPQGSGDEMN